MEVRRLIEEKERLAEAAIIGSHTSLGNLSGAIKTSQGRKVISESHAGERSNVSRSNSSYEDSQLLDDWVGEINEKSSRLEWKVSQTCQNEGEM